MPIYADIYDGPPRWYTDRRTRKLWVMIHATANTASAEAEASYAKRRPDRVSSHYYVDDDSLKQSLDTDLRAWHAGNDEGNDHAIAYELTARNMNVGRAWWLDLDNIEWPLFAGQVAKDCREHGIRAQQLSDAQLRAGTSGFTTHVQGNRVWGGSDHTDPGPNFPMDHLVRQVRALLDDDEEDDMPTVEEIWEDHGIDISPTRRRRPSTALGLAAKYAGRAAKLSAEAVAGQAAILAAVQGQDAAQAAADAARNAVREELAGVAGDLAEQLAVHLPGLTQEQIRAATEAAVRGVLGGLDEDDEAGA